MGRRMQRATTAVLNKDGTRIWDYCIEWKADHDEEDSVDQRSTTDRKRIELIQSLRAAGLMVSKIRSHDRKKVYVRISAVGPYPC